MSISSAYTRLSSAIPKIQVSDPEQAAEITDLLDSEESLLEQPSGGEADELSIVLDRPDFSGQGLDVFSPDTMYTLQETWMDSNTSGANLSGQLAQAQIRRQKANKVKLKRAHLADSEGTRIFPKSTARGRFLAQQLASLVSEKDKDNGSYQKQLKKVYSRLTLTERSLMQATLEKIDALSAARKDEEKAKKMTRLQNQLSRRLASSHQLNPDLKRHAF